MAEAMEIKGGNHRRVQVRRAPRVSFGAERRQVFLDHLAACCNVKRAAEAAGVGVRAAEAWGADCVIVEKNQGGDMVTSVLKAADLGLPVRPAHARFGKGDRAEPVAMKFETGEAKLAGSFPELEDELCAMTRGGGYAGPGRSPDRADAMVWALSELLLGTVREPSIRRL